MSQTLYKLNTITNTIKIQSMPNDVKTFDNRAPLAAEGRSKRLNY